MRVTPTRVYTRYTPLVLTPGAPPARVLHLSGVGFKVFSQPGRTALHVGYSHYVVVRTPVAATVRSRRSHMVVHHQPAAGGVGDLPQRVCRVKRPDPYKGRGLYPVDDRPRLKPGKRR